MIKQLADGLPRPDTQALKRERFRSWRMKAEELRTIADGMKNDHARRGILNAAANYTRLADEAEGCEGSEDAPSRPKVG
jgi:hypothetical protein